MFVFFVFYEKVVLGTTFLFRNLIPRFSLSYRHKMLRKPPPRRLPKLIYLSFCTTHVLLLLLLDMSVWRCTTVMVQSTQNRSFLVLPLPSRSKQAHSYGQKEDSPYYAPTNRSQPGTVSFFPLRVSCQDIEN